MPINPLIALGVRAPNVVPQLQNFTQGIQQQRQRNIVNERADRQDARSQQVHDFNVADAQRKITESQKQSSVKDYAADMLRLDTLLETGDLDGAGQFLQRRAAKLDAMALKYPDANINSADTAQRLQLLRENPEAAKQATKLDLTKLERLGVLKAPTASPLKGFSPGSRVLDAQGNLVTDVPAKPDELSAEAEAQKIRIAQAMGRARGAAGREKIPHASAKTTMFLNGVTQMVLSDGTSTVRDATGAQMVGEDAIAALASGRKAGVADQYERSGARASGAAGQERANKAVDEVEKLRGNVRNIDRALDAIGAGAESGIIDQYLPNITQASKRLAAMQRELGLDVVGAVTFGALSEGELALALATGLPLNMQPAELKVWLTDKKIAQNKLIDYFMAQARYLEGGGKITDWLDQQEQLLKRRQAAEQGAPGQPPGASPLSGASIEQLQERKRALQQGGAQ